MNKTPVKKDSKTIGLHLHSQMASDLTNRADSMHLSVSKYCKIILQQWIDSGNKLNLMEK